MASFYVPGEPVPQGSLTVINGRIIHSNQRRLMAWRKQVGEAAAHLPMLEGPVGLELMFDVERPKSVKREQPHVRPDLDKYIRAVLDALTGVVYEDDGQVCHILASKRYSLKGGVKVTVHA